MKKNPETGFSSGFTLLEILVALVILGLALTAGFYALIQNTAYRVDLKNKLQSHWVALELMTQYRLDFSSNPKMALKTTDHVFRFNQEWNRSVMATRTEIPYVLSVTVHVSQMEHPSIQSTLQGYTAHVE